MATQTTDTQSVSTTPPTYDIAHVKSSAPLTWLRRGADDFRHAPGLSLLYGSLFAGLVAGIFLLTLSLPWYAVGYLTGLVVIGPFLASGLYVASRDIERGASPTIIGSVRLLSQRKTYLALFALMLALIMAAWVRFSALLFAMTFNTLSPSIEAFTSLFTSNDGWITLTLFMGVGFLLAAVVFTVSAVAIPLILDQDTNFITAMQTSYRAVVNNAGAMMVWAAIIVSLTAVGIATAFVGLAVIFPVLGYATWHSYRAMVK